MNASCCPRLARHVSDPLAERQARLLLSIGLFRNSEDGGSLCCCEERDKREKLRDELGRKIERWREKKKGGGGRRQVYKQMGKN